jgi:ATP-binding protein involved in chromosome partitioning
VGKDGSFQLKFHLFKKGGGLDESKRLNIPFLAEIPYSNDLMKSIDDGNPIVFQEKDSEIKNIFVGLAKKIMSL